MDFTFIENVDFSLVNIESEQTSELFNGELLYCTPPRPKKSERDLECPPSPIKKRKTMSLLSESGNVREIEHSQDIFEETDADEIPPTQPTNENDVEFLIDEINEANERYQASTMLSSFYIQQQFDMNNKNLTSTLQFCNTVISMFIKRENWDLNFFASIVTPLIDKSKVEVHLYKLVFVKDLFTPYYQYKPCVSLTFNWKNPIPDEQAIICSLVNMFGNFRVFSFVTEDLVDGPFTMDWVLKGIRLIAKSNEYFALLMNCGKEEVSEKLESAILDIQKKIPLNAKHVFSSKRPLGIFN